VRDGETVTVWTERNSRITAEPLAGAPGMRPAPARPAMRWFSGRILPLVAETAR
jgi:hypothetical protein